jgi:hypothetical protein
VQPDLNLRKTVFVLYSITDQENIASHVPKTEVIIPRHGFVSGLFGLRTRNFGRGGKGREAADLTVEEVLGLGTIVAN